jgi:hypothetical protein
MRKYPHCFSANSTTLLHKHTQLDLGNNQTSTNSTIITEFLSSRPPGIITLLSNFFISIHMGLVKMNFVGGYHPTILGAAPPALACGLTTSIFLFKTSLASWSVLLKTNFFQFSNRSQSILKEFFYEVWT